MASAPPTPGPTQTVRPTAAASTTEYDDFVDKRIAQTRTAVKSADLATGFATLLSWGLGLLLLTAAADHWLVAGGFDRWERFVLFVVGLGGAGLYVATRLGPTLLRSVNPLYAAQEIERESPELKNRLLNLLQLRDARETANVRKTLERQAAESLARTGDAPIDHTPLIRIARRLLVIVAVIGVYVVASPKDFFASAGRVLAPWANIAAPSRVQIDTIEPGSASLAQGDRLEVSAMVAGLREDELVELVYTTRDGRVVDRRVPMTASGGGLTHRVTLPPGAGAVPALGLQGDLAYHLEAGDARTPSYRVEVLTAPTIAPVTVRYDYPRYTRYEPREVEGVADLKAIEGTRITVTATANLPIDSAQIDLGADGRTDFRMRVEGSEATGSFVLRRDAQGDSPTSYVLRFTSTDGQANHDPPRYRIEVLPDLPPEPRLLEPEEPTRDVALNEATRIVGEARDPDYALSRVRLLGESKGRSVLEEDLLSGDGRGLFVGDAVVTPGDLGLRPGDVLEYWIEAADNRTPEANVVASPRQRLRVVGPAEGDQGGEAGGQDGQPDANGQRQPGAGGQPDQGQSGEGQPNGAGQRPRPDQPNQQPNQQPGSESGQQPPNGEEQPQDQPNQGEEAGDSGTPPPGGLTGPGDATDGSPSEENSDGAGTESSGDDEQPGESSPGGGQNAADQPRSSDAERQEGSDPAGDSGQGQSGGQRDSGGDGSSEDASPVARDGSDDGSAFEQIQEFLDNEGESDSGEPQGDQNQGEPSGDPSPEGNDASGSENPADGGESGNEANPSPNESMPADGRPGSESGEQRPRDDAAGEQPERAGEGPGPGEQDRSGNASDSKSSESGGEAPPGESTDPQAGPRQGTDGAGQGQAADQGAGQSADRGAGDATDRPGGEQTSETPTGQSGGEEAGDGSQSREADRRGQPSDNANGQDGAGNESGDQASQGDQPGDSSDGQPSGDQSGDPGSDPSAGDPSGEGAEEIADRRGEGADPSAGGQRGPTDGPQELVDRGPTSDAAGKGSEVGGDAANLDYARKQTDLVLERLEKQLQKKEVDRRLLDKLGWSENDLRRFVDRWQSRREQAARRGAEGQAELDRALQSLGLKPNGPTATRDATQDTLRDLKQRARPKTPPRLSEALERYLRGVNTPTED